MGRSPNKQVGSPRVTEEDTRIGEGGARRGPVAVAHFNRVGRNTSAFRYIIEASVPPKYKESTPSDPQYKADLDIN